MDQSLIHADIFFFITTVFVIVLGLGIAVAVAYLIVILREGSKLITSVREEAECWKQDIAEFRTELKKKGPRLATFITLIQSLFKGHGKKSKSK